MTKIIKCFHVSVRYISTRVSIEVIVNRKLVYFTYLLTRLNPPTYRDEIIHSLPIVTKYQQISAGHPYKWLDVSVIYIHHTSINIYIYTYIYTIVLYTQSPKTMKHNGFGPLKTRLFIIKTCKNVG